MMITALKLALMGETPVLLKLSFLFFQQEIACMLVI